MTEMKLILKIRLLVFQYWPFPHFFLHRHRRSLITIATAIVQSKLDYCNLLYYNLPEYQLNRLQLIRNSLAHVVVRAPSLQYLHWLKITGA